MIRKTFTLLALTLVAAAVAAPIAQSSPTPKVDPLAVSYLMGKGLSRSEVTSWTVGACSQQVKPVSCYGMLQPTTAPAKVDPLAVSYLIGLGLSPSEVTSWTAGVCSLQVKAASCYAMLERASTTTASTLVVRSIGFQWGDAGIGAGFALGTVLLLAGAAGLLISRQNRRRTAHA